MDDGRAARPGGGGADPAPETSKIEFAHALRGWAALAVVSGHFGVMFWRRPEIIAGLVHLPMPEPEPRPPVVARALGGISDLVPGVTSNFTFGAFGVALFFLISGFVIPFSFRRQSRAGFLAGRVLRLGPTYAAGFTVALLALLGGALSEGRPFPYPAGHVAAHYVIGLRQLLWLPPIDGIVWTLEVEIKFYLLCALAAPWLAAGRLRVFALAPALAAGALALGSRCDEWLVDHPLRFRAAWVAAFDSQMIVYMLIGTAFHYLYRGRLRPRRAAMLVAGLFGLAVLCDFLGCAPETAARTAFGQGLALAAFAACYRFRERFRGGGLSSWLADVSYPLYAVHGIAGYVLMNLLLRRGVSAEAAFASAFASAFALAWAIHVAVERPTRTIATRVARAMSPTDVRPAAPLSRAA